MLTLALLAGALLPSLALASKAPRSGSGIVRSSVTAKRPASNLTRRDIASLARRQDDVTVTNQKGGTSYTIDVDIGTPAQTITLILDTGSSDLWVNPTCSESGQIDYCNSFPQFDYTESSTIEDTGYADILGYGKGNVTIEYVTDMVTIGSVTIENQVFGVGFESYDIPLGIIGLSPPTSDAQTQYSFVLDSMVTQGLIDSRAFTLDLRNIDDKDGSVIFGGLDTGKFIGSLEKCPILDPLETPDGADRYWINMNSIAITLPDGTTTTLGTGDQPVFLDSGGTLTRLPTEVFEAIGESFPGAEYDSSSGFYVVDCSVADVKGSVDFGFGNKVIQVLYADFIWEVPGDEVCVLGVLAGDDAPVLGDSFLRAAYVVYDQDNRNLHLAQADDCGDNLVAISTGANAVPSVTGKCTSTAPTATKTGESPPNLSLWYRRHRLPHGQPP
ncbi:putative candidapepsin precursor protein [Phaeoacremonium minimum UCRPA7]|uniref:Putative candidapepsin protein n=1 Tax=Phaeoacremonium minimum (strain UCR-PA7) TaxID=1286976 RepID=R8BM46_PHAM7|nr:putative candidapepsin precursor protein [Phaeoacremonium minimum UCRPA7]EOO00448.1 putative candidapepsin precursor protein [Phaeoacremonium minimum UCRPA7]